MNLKILFMLLIYYSILSAVFIFGANAFSGDYNVSIALNDSELGSSEIDTGGLFGTGISFTRFIGLVSFGIGLPEDTPSFFTTLFVMWQTLVTIFSVAFVISSIWNG